MRLDVSERRSCRVLRVSRASLHRAYGTGRRPLRREPPWIDRLPSWIQQHPTFGYQRVATPHPRVQGWSSRATRSDERWAMDVTPIPCGQDGWAHLAAVIDCHDRESSGMRWPFAAEPKTWSAPSKPRVSSGSGRSARRAPRSYGAITDSFSKAAGSERPVATIGCSRSSSRRTRRSRTASSNGSFAWYSRERPHQALGYRSPVQDRAQQSTQVA